MFIKKTIFILLSILFFVLPQNVKAQVLFNDNFDDGNSDGWSIPRNTCSSTWISSSNKYGILTNGCITESIPSSLTIPESSDYTFEVDMSMPLSLNDRNFVFKYKDSNNWYGIHTYQDLFFVQKVVGGQEYFLDNRSVNYDFSIDQTYKFKVVVINNSRYDVYINDSFQVSVYDNSPYFQNFSAGLQASGISQVWFDNIVVTEIPSTTPSPSPTVEPTATPTPTPTPTPTVTPSATPAITPMPVPNLKQYSLPWKNKIYDHTKRSIQEFGCALTSAAMVLQYHGHQIMPDSLNDWLNQQSDGYLGNGLVNWLAISRYTKIHDSVNSPTLEYKRLAPTNENLDNEIGNNRPSILKENGHFVVATGKILDKYTINDPGYADRNTLEPYGNSFLSINSYKPTHSDLSYMMFVTDPNLNLELEKSSGANVPIESYVEDPITSITDPNRKSGKAIKITLFEKPENGKYNLKVSGQNGRYELNSYLYDTSGKVTKNTVSGSLHGSDTDIFNITFENKKKISGNDRKSDFKFWFKRFHFFKHFWR